MARKKLRSAAGAAEDQLKAGAKKIRGQLVTVEKAAGKLATRAKERLPAAPDVRADLPGVGRRLKKATSSVTKRRGRAGQTAPRVSRVPSAASTTPAPEGGTTGPDESWTVADLRAEAKKRGMVGYSRKTKAELLADLRP